ncbi:MAG: helix-turn-helix domain-containing protein [Pirellulaceae bacterium]
MSKPKRPKQLLTTRDVAKLLSVSEKTVRRLRDAGKLPPAVHVGRMLRWREEDIAAYIDRL